jgi:uncharacterized protein (DUF3820 family)
MDLMDKYLAWSDRLADRFPFGGMGLLIMIVAGIWMVSLLKALIAWYVQPV